MENAANEIQISRRWLVENEWWFFAYCRAVVRMRFAIREPAALPLLLHPCHWPIDGTSSLLQKRSKSVI